MPPRRDKKGRIIGYNWWREYIVDLLFWADQAWQRCQESTTYGYETEERVFSDEYPRPTLKAFLLDHADPNRYNDANEP